MATLSGPYVVGALLEALCCSFEVTERVEVLPSAGGDTII
jgi:hypothetical protein